MALLLVGCSMQKSTEIKIKGKGIEYPVMGISSIKGDVAEVTIKRAVTIGKVEKEVYIPADQGTSRPVPN